MRDYNTYDMCGLLQGLLDALSKHASAIPLQERVRLATELVNALPDAPSDIPVIEQARPLTRAELYRQQRDNRPSAKTPVPPLQSAYSRLIGE